MINGESDLTVKTTSSEQEQQHYRLQLLAQAIEKVESECTQRKHLPMTASPASKKQHQAIPNDSLTMTSPSFSSIQSQELLMQLFTQQNVAAVMAAAAAAAAQLQLQQQKPEPISPPSTSSASSSVESPLDFSSRRSTDDINDCASPSSPNPHLLSSMLQNLQSSNALSNGNFPFLLTNKNGKPTRPFKAYPRDPLMLPLGFCSGSSAEQANILADAASRATPNRKRLAQTQERLKQRLEQQQQQQALTSTHFISSSGAQILQPPKKRHRVMETSMIQEESSANKDIDSESNNAIKDDAYWERRRKNNEAAKRSRDARRVKEDEIAIR